MRRTILVVFGLVGCSAAPYEDRTVDATPTDPGDPSPTADAAVLAPDAKMVQCPPGLPFGFGNLGTVTATKNGPGSPAMYDSYNVFVDLANNPRWFFAMNLLDGSFQVGNTYEIAGDDTQSPTCRHCINLFADKDTTAGGPSLHMFAQSGRVTITGKSTDRTRVSGRLEDVFFEAIEIVYDEQSISCSDDINDPVCGNSICLNNECGRQVLLAGCSTSIKTMTF